MKLHRLGQQFERFMTTLLRENKDVTALGSIAVVDRDDERHSKTFIPRDTEMQDALLIATLGALWTVRGGTSKEFVAYLSEIVKRVIADSPRHED